MTKLIIYDLDGTLIDSSKDISNSVNRMLTELKLPTLSEEKVRPYVGRGVIHLIQSVLQEISAKQKVNPSEILDRAVNIYKSNYSKHLLDETKLYPGVGRVLEFFKLQKQAVITNKTVEFSRRILKGLGIDPYFFAVIGGDQHFPKKPAPDSVLELIRLAGAKPEEAILVGDSAIDVQTGKNANVKTVAVTYGFVSKEEIMLSQPDVLIDRLDEIIDLI